MADTLRARDAKDVEAAVQWLLAEGKAAEIVGHGSKRVIGRPAQTDVALFWEPATNVQYVQLLRQALEQNPRRSLDWDARFVAAFHAVTTDAQIAIYETKFHYLFWRPVTAIRTGSIDPDPSWNSFFASPRHPEYPSGHSGYAGAAQEVLAAFDGTRPSDPVSATSAVRTPIPPIHGAGIRNPNSASEGIVCSRPDAARTTRPSTGLRAASTPSGTAAAAAASNEGMTSSKCSPVVTSTRPAKVPSDARVPSTPSSDRKNSAATAPSSRLPP